jgi:hypothetical protein
MAREIPNLIPDDFGALAETAPVLFLREQAKNLGPKTGGIVEAKVLSSVKDKTFVHGFFLVVPLLENYTYHVLSVHHSLHYYPLQLINELETKSYECMTEEGYLVLLGGFFNSDAFKRVVNSLMAQAITEG